MADTPEVKVPIKTTFDGAGTSKAAESFADLGDKAKEVGEHFTSLKFITEGMGEALVGLTAAFSVFEVMKEGLEEAVKTEVAFRGIDAAAGKMGFTVEEGRTKVKEFAEALGELGGVATGTVIGAMSKLITETGNFDEAAARATLAMKIHTNTSYSFEEALAKVEASARGMTRGIQALTGVQLTATGQHEKAVEAMAALNKKFGEMKVHLEDNAGELEKSRARWANLKEDIGDVVLHGIANFIRGIQNMGTELRHVNELGAAVFNALGGYISIAAGWIKDVYTKSFAEANENALKGFKKTTAEFEVEKLVADQKMEHEEEAVEKNLEARIARETKLKAHANQEDMAGRDAVLRNTMSDLEREIRADDAAVDHLDAHYAEGVNKRLAEARREEKEEEALTNKKLAAMLHEIEAEERADKGAHALKIARQKAEVQGALQAAGIVVQLAGDAFGNTKEVAIAGALVNAGSAVVSALAAPYPFDIILPVLVAIEAAAQIAKISSAPAPNLTSTAGAGFDDSGNDQAAYLTGRKWANDMVGKISAGWQSGLGGISAGNSTTTNNQTTNITVTGLVSPGDKEQLKQLARKLAQVTQSDSQRTIARRT